MFKARNKPFVLVFWSRDPDGSQHNQGDSLNTRDARHQRPDLARRHQECRRQSGAVAQGARRSRPCRHHRHHRRPPTTASRRSRRRARPARRPRSSYDDTPKGFLPLGFLAIDLAKALDLPLFDPNDKNARVADNAHPKAGNGVLGNDPAKPDLVVATNGGSDLIYLPNRDKKLAGRARSRRCWSRTMSAACSSTTSSDASPARCRCRRST